MLMASQWPDKCDASTWKLKSNSLNIIFIHSDMYGHVAIRRVRNHVTPEGRAMTTFGFHTSTETAFKRCRTRWKIYKYENAAANSIVTCITFTYPVSVTCKNAPQIISIFGDWYPNLYKRREIYLLRRNMQEKLVYLKMLPTKRFRITAFVLTQLNTKQFIHLFLSICISLIWRPKFDCNFHRIDPLRKLSCIRKSHKLSGAEAST